MKPVLRLALWMRNWLTAQALFLVLGALRTLPAQRAMAATVWMAEKLGPLSFRHKLALYNLHLAFPEKSAAERARIARAMWGHMARLLTEYVFMEKLVAKVTFSEDTIVDVNGLDLFFDLRDHPRPFIVFTAHLGSFEFLPIAASSYGLEVTALFRRPNNPFFADRLQRERGARMKNLVPSTAGAAWQLAATLEGGRGVGLLVDQRFGKGVKTHFFGRPVRTNPLLAKLARQYECAVFPARCLRIDRGRFLLEIEPALHLPRAENGTVDIEKTMQIVNDKVETWVRETPEQWQWFHDRWDAKEAARHWQRRGSA